MRNNAILVAVLTTFILASLVQAKSIGMVIAVEGTASAVGSDGKTRSLILKSDIFTNDKIITASESKLQIMFEDDSIISQGEKSEIMLDKYVYDPGADKEEVDSKMSLLKGVFRVVTGKITEINPDRFKVQTRMATIGVRGCELCFKVTKKKENVYILWLPEGKSIHIEKNEDSNELLTGAMESADGILNVIQSGVAVTIEKGAGLQQRDLMANEARELVNESTPNASSGGVDDGKDGSGSEAGKTLNLLSSTIDNSNEKQNEISQFADAGMPPIPPRPSEDPPNDLTPTKAPPVLTSPGTSPGSPWWWEVLADGVVEYGLAAGRSDLDSADLAEIANGGASRTLTGSGTAGAILKDGANEAIVSGTVAMNVTVGGGSPSWTADIRMSSGTSHLDFDASGSVELDGELKGNIDEGSFSYTMQVDGGPVYNSSGISDDSVDGQLYGVGITGCAGEYHFDHGGGTTADGAFGSDLM